MLMEYDDILQKAGPIIYQEKDTTDDIKLIKAGLVLFKIFVIIFVPLFFLSYIYFQWVDWPFLLLVVGLIILSIFIFKLKYIHTIVFENGILPNQITMPIVKSMKKLHYIPKHDVIMWKMMESTEGNYLILKLSDGTYVRLSPQNIQQFENALSSLNIQD